MGMISQDYKNKNRPSMHILSHWNKCIMNFISYLMSCNQLILSKLSKNQSLNYQKNVEKLQF